MFCSDAHSKSVLLLQFVFVPITVFVILFPNYLFLIAISFGVSGGMKFM